MQRNDELSLNKTAPDLYISRRSVQNIAKQELGLRKSRLLRQVTLTEAAKKDWLEKWKKKLNTIREGRLSNVVWTV